MQKHFLKSSQKELSEAGPIILSIYCSLARLSFVINQGGLEQSTTLQKHNDSVEVSVEVKLVSTNP